MISLRTQIAQFYLPVISNDGGYASERYYSDGTLYPCRLVETRSRERLTTKAGAFVTSGVLELADELTVTTDMLVQVDGLTYAVRGITRRRSLAALQLEVEWTDQPLAARAPFVYDAGYTYDSGEVYL